ncbi:MAG: hypothetical protein LBJ17_06135 [Dysgonamonadaceae bacterium]|jgi:hypothetical protein|nr:hypothetical protein [Dysgonamonadaceae bacterium]
MKRRFDLLVALSLALVCGMVFTACEDEDDNIKEPFKVTPKSGVFILNQGNFGASDAFITYIDFESGNTTKVLVDELGESAQDLIIYGNKIYVSVTGSSVIWVLSLSDLSVEKRIEVKDASGEPRSPFCLQPYSNKIYATTNDGNVVRLDTASLEIEAFTPVGNNPEGIAIYDGKLYVGITNGYAYPSNFDNKLAVVDIATFTTVETITVGVNPNRILPDGNGNLYISYRGNYSYYEPAISGGLQKLNLSNKTLTEIDAFSNQDFTIINDTLYSFGSVYNPYPTTVNYYGRYNTKTGQIISGEWLKGTSEIKTPYALAINPDNGDVYVADYNFPDEGKIFIFGRDGEKKEVFSVGFAPYKIVFR